MGETANITLTTSFTNITHLKNTSQSEAYGGMWYEIDGAQISICIGIMRPTYTGSFYAGYVSNATKINGTSVTIDMARNGAGWGDKSSSAYWESGTKYKLAHINYTPTFDGNTTVATTLSYYIEDYDGEMLGTVSGTVSLPAITITSGLPTYTVSAINVDTNYDGTLKTAQLVIDSTSANDDYTHFRVWSGTSTTYSGLNNTPTTASQVDLLPGIYGDAFQTHTIPVYYQIIGDGYATGTQTGSTNVIIHPIGSVVQIYDTATQSWYPGELHVYHNNDWQIGKMYVNSLGNWKDVAE